MTTACGTWVEFSVEYLKRLSPGVRLNLALRAARPAPWTSGICRRRAWQVHDRFFLKLDNADRARLQVDDWAPDLGVVWSLGR